MTSSEIGLNALIGVWLLITGLGITQAWQLLRRATAARDWLVDKDLNGIRLHAAAAAIRLANARIFVQVCLFLMGVDALALQFVDRGSSLRVVLSGLFRLLMIAVAATLTFKSRMEIHELNRVIDQTQRVRVHQQNIAAGDLNRNTEALIANTEANRFVAYTLENGPLTASIANTAALIANTKVHTDELGANTASVEANTEAVDENTKAQIGGSDE